MSKIASNPKTVGINVRMLPEMKAQADFDLRGAPYTDPESMEALQEAIQLMNDPTARRFKSVDELFAECLEG